MWCSGHRLAPASSANAWCWRAARRRLPSPVTTALFARALELWHPRVPTDCPGGSIDRHDVEIRDTDNRSSQPKPLSPLAPEEIADRLVPSDPRISPDGSRVIFAVSPGSKAGEKWTRSLWIAGDDLPARQLQLARPMIAMPAGRLMARECSSARIA